MDTSTIIGIVVPIALGALIGAGTNWVALRLLFIPYTEKRLFGFRVPFTPGMIPKGRTRLAKSIGEAVSENLLNKEALESHLLSENSVNGVVKKLDTMVSKISDDNDTVIDKLGKYTSQENIEYVKGELTKTIKTEFSSCLKEGTVTDTLANSVTDYIVNKAPLGMGSFIKDPVSNIVKCAIDDIVVKNQENIAESAINPIVDKFMQQPISKFAPKNEEQRTKMQEIVRQSYKEIVSTVLPDILETVDIKSVIESQINNMEMEKIEKLVMDVSSKELNSLVWLGGVLGAIIGVINIFI